MRTERALARQHIGYCPQSNVLFSSLTVFEHLLFFAAVKCLSGKQAVAAADEMLQAVRLTAKKDSPVTALSGGMKRRLQVRQHHSIPTSKLLACILHLFVVMYLQQPQACHENVLARLAILQVALALLGRSAVVILDEPTCGEDSAWAPTSMYSIAELDRGEGN